MDYAENTALFWGVVMGVIVIVVRVGMRVAMIMGMWVIVRVVVRMRMSVIMAVTMVVIVPVIMVMVLVCVMVVFVSTSAIMLLLCMGFRVCCTFVLEPKLWHRVSNYTSQRTQLTQRVPNAILHIIG